MARTFRYLTHPEVRIDPSVPVPESTRSIFSSGERKARETAEIVAAELDLEITGA